MSKVAFAVPLCSTSTNLEHCFVAFERCTGCLVYIGNDVDDVGHVHFAKSTYKHYVL